MEGYYKVVMLFRLLIFAASTLWAQVPPFQTDDPVPVDLHHYEFYIFGSVAGHAGGNRPDWAGFRVQLGRPSQSATARHSSNRRYLPVEQSHLPAWRNGTERLRYHRHGIGRQDRLHQRIEVHSPDRHLYYV